MEEEADKKVSLRAAFLQGSLLRGNERIEMIITLNLTLL
jgi:hypothetical protein